MADVFQHLLPATVVLNVARHKVLEVKIYPGRQDSHTGNHRNFKKIPVNAGKNAIKCQNVFPTHIYLF